METSLTIVLPIHNAEATLRKNVSRVLEVAGELTPRFEVLLVDDGSTDDTYDIASEIAAGFPQVSVMRSGARRGLGATMREVKRRASGRVVIVHDGVSTLNANELRALYRGADEELSIEDLRRPLHTHPAMVAAHSRLRGFQVIESDDAQDLLTNKPTQRKPRPHTHTTGGVGQVPTLPTPNFMGAVGDFALGE